jgi:integrase
MALRQAVVWGLIDRNPAQGVILPKLERRESAAMSAAEMKRFAAACRRDDRFIMFELGLETALRPQELLALRWSDVDLAKRRLRVRQAVTTGFTTNAVSIKEPKTAGSKRTVGFSEAMRDRLKRQKAIVDKRMADLEADIAAPLLLDHKKAKGANYAKRKKHRELCRDILISHRVHDLVFPSHSGGPLAMNNVNRREMKDALRAAGIDERKYSLKTLRHSALTALAEHLHPKKLQTLAGHSSPEVSLRYYVHVSDNSVHEASDIISGMFSEPAK